MILAWWDGSSGRNFLGAKGIVLGIAKDFFRCCHALLNQAPAVFRQAAQAGARRRLAKFVAGTILQDHPANLIRGIHPFKNPAAAVVSRLPAISAADGAKDSDLGRKSEIGFQCLRRQRLVLLFAFRAENTHQPLREDCFQ